MHADETGRPGDENRLLQNKSFRVAHPAARTPLLCALGWWSFVQYKAKMPRESWQ
jgi:hypothetical protein